MLRITFNENKNTQYRVDDVFKSLFIPDWLEDSLVKEMVEDVDKSKVLSPYCIQSPVLGQISPYMLSGGVKALILMLKTDYEIWASACGDNCAKWILEIANKKDLTICLENYMDFGEDFDFYCIDSGQMERYEKYTDEHGPWW